ncbi:MAG: 3-isopropylmalate dehydratase [Desulfurococcales archaeon]|nr:3-isopropylmalate dehydratase [Desulfurococcales archaeon]
MDGPIVIEGRAWRLGDGITTDHIISGKYKYAKMGRLEDMLPYLLEEVIPGFYKMAREGDVIVAGSGFGYGSSREHAARLLRMAGIRVVVAESIHRIFYRNAVNNGILPIISRVIPASTRTGDRIRVDARQGVIVNLDTGARDRFNPPPGLLMEVINAGGMVEYIKRRGLPW